MFFFFLVRSNFRYIFALLLSRSFRLRTIFWIFYCLLYEQKRRRLLFAPFLFFSTFELVHFFQNSHTHTKTKTKIKQEHETETKKKTTKISSACNGVSQYLFLFLLLGNTNKTKTTTTTTQNGQYTQKYSGKSENYEQPKTRWNHLKILLHKCFFLLHFLAFSSSSVFIFFFWYVNDIFFFLFGILSVAQSHHFISFIHLFIHSSIYRSAISCRLWIFLSKSRRREKKSLCMLIVCVVYVARPKILKLYLTTE